ncbi:hypothetical protein PROFUN_05707 [Planoprotostelium fungivorum]|uniref:Uncharacterized protein n=1 Tax=Planoprotostelium fungivorum TaxID=1890364 RepID=A0A2P6NQG4_9EUKA|nr:hypothetical protein PROFUN_05707 [Planoprotostelium fungivorum]
MCLNSAAHGRFQLNVSMVCDSVLPWMFPRQTSPVRVGSCCFPCRAPGNLPALFWWIRRQLSQEELAMAQNSSFHLMVPGFLSIRSTLSGFKPFGFPATTSYDEKESPRSRQGRWLLFKPHKREQAEATEEEMKSILAVCFALLVLLSLFAPSASSRVVHEREEEVQIVPTPAIAARQVGAGAAVPGIGNGKPFRIAKALKKIRVRYPAVEI